MKTLYAILLATASATLCSAQSDGKPIELQHVDVTNVDSSVQPCENFYQYVCKKRIAENPMPADQAVWGVAGQLNQWNRQILREILEKHQAPNASRTPNEQKIGDFYASCMTQASAGANDIKAIEPILARINNMKDKREIAEVLAQLHLSFGAAWQGDNNQTPSPLLGFGPTPDFNDVNRIVAGIDQGGLGMPSRDFYLKDDEKSKAIQDSYKTLIIELLKMDGAAEAAAARDAATILRVETALAKGQMNNIDRRDPNKLNNRFTLAELKALTPAFDWSSYLHGINAPEVPFYVVTAPDFFRTMNKLLTDEDLATWKLYLRWQTLLNSSKYLGNSWRDAQFNFEKQLTGRAMQPPDWRRCTNAVDSNLGEALGQVYVAKVFPPESKARALKMITDIEASMGRDIDEITWMQPETKRQAHLKLAAVINKIGYPDKWIDYSALAVTRDGYVANVEHGTAFEFKRQLAFIGKPFDRTQWFMTPPTLNAYEDPQQNSINFPAGMLQPPYFDAQLDDAVNYGGEGTVAGHELTHGFDDEGRKFDLHGNLKDWWTPADAKAYDERGECIAKEYTGPVPGVPDVQQNGKLTQGEDTADNGGIYLALSALAQDLKEQGKSLEDKDDHGLTNLQRFFIAYGTAWCEEIRPELQRTLVLTNTHSLPELRVNNVLSNMPEFQKAFSCKAGQPMVHATHCRVW
jgi:endothelin-converting enzyme/putative endopeptidase